MQRLGQGWGVVMKGQQATSVHWVTYSEGPPQNHFFFFFCCGYFFASFAPAWHSPRLQ